MGLPQESSAIAEVAEHAPIFIDIFRKYLHHFLFTSFSLLHFTFKQAGRGAVKKRDNHNHQSKIKGRSCCLLLVTADEPLDPLGSFKNFSKYEGGYSEKSSGLARRHQP